VKMNKRTHTAGKSESDGVITQQVTATSPTEE